MRVLIIGGTRFIGRHLVDALLRADVETAVFNRGETASDLANELRFIRGDRRDLRSFRKTFAEYSPDVVVDTICFNTEEAEATVATFSGIADRLIVLSSADVYQAHAVLWGKHEEIQPMPLTEESALRKNRFPYRDESVPDASAYSYDKVFVEQVVGNTEELRSTVLRLPAVYGPQDYRKRVENYLDRMDLGASAILVDAGQAGWRWTRGYVENIAAAIARATTDARTAGQIYNLGSEPALSEAEWIGQIAQVAGWQGTTLKVPAEKLPVHLRSRYNWAQDWITDATKFHAATGFKEPFTAADGLKRTVDWIRSRPRTFSDSLREELVKENEAAERLTSEH